MRRIVSQNLKANNSANSNDVYGHVRMSNPAQRKPTEPWSDKLKNKIVRRNKFKPLLNRGKYYVE